MRPFHLAFPVTNLLRLNDFMSKPLVVQLVGELPLRLILISMDTKLLPTLSRHMPDNTNGGESRW